MRQYYGPFGEVCFEYTTWHNSALPTTYAFTGQRLDSGSGLMYYGARYYDPALAHFISADPLVSDPLNPKNFNRYSYVFYNPLRYTDPTGCCTYDPRTDTYTDVGKLDCTVNDFDQMTAEMRLAWVRSFTAYYGLGNVFNGVQGAIRYFAASDVEYHLGLGGIDFTPGTSWMSRADAYTLAAMQDGMSIYMHQRHRGGPYNARSTLNFSDKDGGVVGPNDWADFYDAYYTSGKNFYAPGVAQAWGRSEFYAVHYAIRQSDKERGRPGGEQGYLIAHAIYATDIFRLSMIYNGVQGVDRGTFMDPTSDPSEQVAAGLGQELRAKQVWFQYLAGQFPILIPPIPGFPGEPIPGDENYSGYAGNP